VILLDTNALVWTLSDSSMLGSAARRLLRDGGVHFSSVSVLELVMKGMLGTFSLPQPPAEAAVRAGLRELPFTAEHANSLKEFPTLMRHDPFDRMLLAQARSEGWRLVTSDSSLLALGLDWVIDANA
jgi:PIN domain nuclease of toxin-antitoxin system